MFHTEHLCPVERVTNGPFHHFFGYYEKTPWDATGRYLLGHRVAFLHRPNTPEDMAVIGLIDTQQGNRWQPLAETTVWCWQQATMLQWLGSAPDREIIFNTRNGHDFCAALLDIQRGEQRLLPMPIYAVAPDGRYAMSLNFARLDRTRPGYGYKGGVDHTAGQLAPAETGVYHIDLQSGVATLVVSLAQLAQTEPEATMPAAEHWVNHIQISRTGQRVAFLHRWRAPGMPSWRTRLYTVNPDGSKLHLLAREGMVSHYDWRGDSHILAWSRHQAENHYHLYHDCEATIDVVGADVLDRDGHCSYSPDGRWVLTDCYPDPAKSIRTLMLYEPATNRRIDLGHFYSPPELTGEIRCDLHPRWNRTGTKVCLDSAHEGTRQMYVVDVTAVIRQ